MTEVFYEEPYYMLRPAPQPKGIEKFTGEGWEIFGDPSGEEGGTINSDDGIFDPSCAIKQRDEVTEITKRAMQLSLNRAEKAESMRHASPEYLKEIEQSKLEGSTWRQNAEDRDRLKAQELGAYFADSIHRGELYKFAKSIVCHFENKPRSTKNKELAAKIEEGYFRALSAVCTKAKHPKDITMGAVKTEIENNREAYKKYEIISAKIEVS